MPLGNILLKNNNNNDSNGEEYEIWKNLFQMGHNQPNGSKVGSIDLEIIYKFINCEKDIIILFG